MITQNQLFHNIHYWDDVLSLAAGYRQDIDANRWQLGDLVHWACPRRQAGRPEQADERWNISALAYAIGEDRSMLSQLAANAEFWAADIRDEIPDNVSWKQLSKARRLTGWRPGKPVTDAHRVEALNYIIAAADNELPRPKLTVETYALRAVRAGEGALRNCEMPESMAGMFKAVTQTGLDILEMLSMLEDKNV